MPRKSKDDDKLAVYRSKRQAEHTTEPFGSDSGARQRDLRGRFVIHKHAATRLHYDLRLEVDGVLQSWAVPKDITLDPEEKNLAVMVEPHPLEYGDFEGVIPPGNYGAGPTIIWDMGYWTAEDGQEAWDGKGELKFSLHGYKLAGRFTLVRTKRNDGKDWLLIKKKDGYASDKSLSEQSVVSGCTIDDLKNDNARFSELRDEVMARGLKEADFGLADISPMLCVTADEPFDDDDWLFEIKYDGFRLMAEKAPGQPVRLRYRSGQDATIRYPELTNVLSRVPLDSFILDGELVAFGLDGKPSFHLLQQRTQRQRLRDIEHAARTHPISFMVFDLLSLEGYDTRHLALTERKKLLRRFIPEAGAVRYVDHVEGIGRAFFEKVSKLDLEGVVAKQKRSHYTGRRNGKWKRIVAARTGVFWVVGYTEPEGSRAGLGSVNLALETEDGQWIYRGRVGSGFSGDELADLRRKLDDLPPWKPPFSTSGKKGNWLTPTYKCLVSYRMLSPEGALRFPVWRGLIDGLDTTDEVGDSPSNEAAIADGGQGASRVRVTNRGKIFFPEQGITKGQLVDYYHSVAQWMLPYLAERPVVLIRYPDGIEGKSFYQRNAPSWVPKWIHTQKLWSEGGDRYIHYFICDTVDTLLYLANLGAIPLHIWSSRLAALHSPDYVSLDLDPKDAPFSQVIECALEIKYLCECIEIESFVKTSGSSGLHILIPLGQRYSHDQAKSFAHIMARLIEQWRPDIATTERSLEKRGNKVYIDWGQNGYGQLLVCPLSVRAKPGAPVSMPLPWAAVKELTAADDFTIGNASEHLQKHGDPLVGILAREGIDMADAIERLSALDDTE